MLRATHLLVPLSLLCISCNDAAIEPSQSLVGATHLPSAKALSRERLFITRGGGPYGGHALIYDWQADNTLTITHTFSDNNARETVKGRETFRVAPEVATQIKRVLWRVRPAKLEREGWAQWEIRPIGCQRAGPHDLGDIQVLFVNEGSDGLSEDDPSGLFALPGSRSCNTRAAVDARNVVWAVLRLLPKSKVAAAYDLST